MDRSLPEGYSAREVEGRVYLFDPQGIPLHGPTDSSLIEGYAWRHAWRVIERELNKELTDFHAGVRPLHSLRRLRQYVRMLDAVALGEMPREVEERPVRRRLVVWGTLAASAAAVAAVLLITPVRTPRVPERTPHPAVSSQPATVEHPAPALPAEHTASGNVRVAPTGRAVEISRGVVRAARTGQHLTKYAVSFGAFVNRTTADSMMHFIRSKGYIVYVARIGEDFRVVTRPYRSRAQAERLANALQEIGLPAQLAPLAPPKASRVQGTSSLE